MLSSLQLLFLPIFSSNILSLSIPTNLTLCPLSYLLSSLPIQPPQLLPHLAPYLLSSSPYWRTYHPPSLSIILSHYLPPSLPFQQMNLLFFYLPLQLPTKYSPLTTDLPPPFSSLATYFPSNDLPPYLPSSALNTCLLPTFSLCLPTHYPN